MPGSFDSLGARRYRTGQMDASRTVWVVTDSLGRRLVRGSVSRRTLELWGAALALAAFAALWAAAASMRLQRDARRARVLMRQSAALQAQIDALDEAAPQLQALLLRNEGAVRQLERKSGFTFVALAPAAGSGPGAPRLPAAGGDVAAAPSDAFATPEAAGEADALLARGRRLETWLGALLEYWHDAERRLANTPSIRPARTAWLSSSYGVRTDPITHVTVMHKGLDMAGYIGMLIYAPADGKVIWTGVRGGYGQVVVIDHGWGLQTHFAHLSKYLVERGDKVRRGEPIAEMGNTGRSTGPHLHYEVRQDGFPIDPRNFILD